MGGVKWDLSMTEPQEEDAGKEGEWEDARDLE